MTMEFEYTVEYARSSRSGCRGCRKKIKGDDLRIGLMQKSTLFEGNQVFWYHLDCMFHGGTHDVPRSIELVHNLDKINDEDKERVGQAIAGATGGGMSAEEAKGCFKVERAKSGRSTCRACKEPIPKDEIRLAKMTLPGDEKVFRSPVPAWHHMDCFANLDDPDWKPASYNSFSGFQDLDPEALELLKSKFGSGGGGEQVSGGGVVSGGKRKAGRRGGEKQEREEEGEEEHEEGGDKGKEEKVAESGGEGKKKHETAGGRRGRVKEGGRGGGGTGAVAAGSRKRSASSSGKKRSHKKKGEAAEGDGSDGGSGKKTKAAAAGKGRAKKAKAS